MKLSEIKAQVVDIDKEIDHAAQGIGTLAEVTPEVRRIVKSYLDGKDKVDLNTASDGDIAAMFRNIPDHHNFALKIALKVAGRRYPHD